MKNIKKKKVLIMYARYGSGHKSIAEHVSEYLKSQGTLKDVIRDLAVTLNYPAIVARIDSSEQNLDEK